jgi:SAM-dependent methyltransferase
MFGFKSSGEPPHRAQYREVTFAHEDGLITLTPAAIEIARSYRVLPHVHFDDLVFASVFARPTKRDLDAAAELYFRSGHTSAERIRNIAAIHYVERTDNGVLDRRLRLLDFASGYGCASRHIRNLMPATDVTAMDIHAAACDFHRDHLGISARLSELEPNRLAAQAEFDVVAGLSFFSHLPKRLFVPWLRKLGEFVAPGGILIFTTNGANSHLLVPQLRVGRDGYGSIRDSEQYDIPLDYYIHTVTYPHFVESAIDRLEGFRLRMQFRGIWWNIQDCYVLERSK